MASTCVGECRPSGLVTPLWRQWRIGTTLSKVRPSATTSKRRTSLLRGDAMSKSLTITFVDTAPFCPEAFLVLHAARWWPKASSGRPHKQMHTVRGKGRRRRRSNNTRNGSESNVDTRWIGVAVKGTELNGHLAISPKPAHWRQLGPHNIDAVVFVHGL